MANSHFKSIRELTRLALPVDDQYLFRLGVALYGFASVASFMAEVVSHLDPSADQQATLEKAAGDIVADFRSAAKKWQGAPIKRSVKTAAKVFEKLNIERNDFVHAYPITGVGDVQILHRRYDTKRKDFEVSEPFLDDFISRLTRVSDALYEIRGVVTQAAE